VKIVLRNEICDKLENIVKNLKTTKHCIGCEGLDLNNKDPHHHPSIEITQECNHNCIFCYSKLLTYSHD
jgi:tRNA A37 methylthiotransferase MiaB